MSDIFYDRRGHEKYADEIIPLHQKGYFAILVKDEKVLVTYPPQVSVPEFPGGTVSRREDFRGCLYRKLYEETGIEFELDWGEKSYQQIVNYFAEDARPFGEYCVYDQTFIVYDASSYGFDTSVSPWRTPENGNAEHTGHFFCQNKNQLHTLAGFSAPVQYQKIKQKAASPETAFLCQ